MHPRKLRFLDPKVALATLKKGDESDAPLDEGEAHLVAAAKSHPDERARGLAEQGAATERESALLYLAVQATVRALRDDPSMSVHVRGAEEALGTAGANDEERDAFLAELVAEEAFALGEEVDEFDRAWLGEALDGVAKLLALSSESVSALLDRFVQTRPLGSQQVAEQVALSLIEAAWAEGPGPIFEQHLDEALQALDEELPSDRLGEAVAELRRFVPFLRREGIIGPLREERLLGRLALVAGPVGARA